MVKCKKQATCITMGPIYEMHTHKMWENSRIEILVVSLTGKISNDFFFLLFLGIYVTLYMFLRWFFQRERSGICESFL